MTKYSPLMQPNRGGEKKVYMTLFYFEVEHPVIYLPGISTLRNDGSEYQVTFVRVHRIFAFKEKYGFEWRQMRIKLMSKFQIFWDYWRMPVGYGLPDKIDIKTAWELAEMLTPTNKAI